MPMAHRLEAELSEFAAGDQVTLYVEGIVDGGMDGEKALSGAWRALSH